MPLLANSAIQLTLQLGKINKHLGDIILTFAVFSHFYASEKCGTK